MECCRFGLINPIEGWFNVLFSRILEYFRYVILVKVFHRPTRSHCHNKDWGLQHIKGQRESLQYYFVAMINEMQSRRVSGKHVGYICSLCRCEQLLLIGNWGYQAQNNIHVQFCNHTDVRIKWLELHCLWLLVSLVSSTWFDSQGKHSCVVMHTTYFTAKIFMKCGLYSLYMSVI